MSAATPADAVAREHIGEIETAEKKPNRLKRLLAVIRPGLITGAASDDHSRIGTYATASADIRAVAAGINLPAGIAALVPASVVIALLLMWIL